MDAGTVRGAAWWASLGKHATNAEEYLNGASGYDKQKAARWAASYRVEFG
jgi:hypothetical protein